MNTNENENTLDKRLDKRDLRDGDAGADMAAGAGDVEVRPSGLAAGNINSAGAGTSTVGSLGGGVLGGAAGYDVEDEERSLDRDESGSGLANSDGVSGRQREVESDEMNG